MVHYIGNDPLVIPLIEILKSSVSVLGSHQKFLAQCPVRDDVATGRRMKFPILAVVFR
jgi:hypothetical protein